LAPDHQLDFASAHPGRKALKEAKERGVEPAAQQAAYTNAMIGWQDRYHQEVSKFFGHDRYGPRRKRVDRARHKANREAEESVSRIRAELELEYRADVSDDEADARTLRVSKVFFIAAAVVKQQEMQREIDRLQAVLRDHGIVDGDISGPVADLQPPHPDVPEPLALPHDLEMMPMPVPRAAQKPGANPWTQLRASIEAKTDERVRRLVSKADPELPDVEPSSDPP
jgi:hypothetical protein